MICPCKGCGDRLAGCHGKCERYKQWKLDRSSFTEDIRRARAHDYPQKSMADEKRWYDTLRDRKK